MAPSTPSLTSPRDKLAQETLRQQSNEMAALARLFRSTTTQLNLQTILEEALHGALALTGLEAGVLCLMDSNTGCLQPGAAVNVSEAMLKALGGQAITAGEGQCGFRPNDLDRSSLEGEITCGARV